MEVAPRQHRVVLDHTYSLPPPSETSAAASGETLTSILER
jgi:hypothetical protein